MSARLTPSRLSDAAFSRRGLLTGAVGVTSLAALSACGGSSTAPQGGSVPSASAGGTAYTGPKVTVSFWCGWTGADGDVAKKMINEFNAATPNITVNMNVMQWADFFTKLPAAVSTSSGPDVAVMHIDDIPTQAAQQVIVPIDEIATALNLQSSDFAPAVWNGGMYNGKRYGIPIDVHDLGLYVNQSVMEKAGLDPTKPPTDENSYMDALDKIKSKAGIQGSWVSPFQFTGGFMFQSLLWQFGGDLYDSSTTNATWNSDAGTKALTWMVGLISKGYSPKNVAQDADYIALKNAKNAFNWQGIWQVNDATTLSTTKITTARLPKIGTQRGVWGNSHQFVLPKTTGQDQNTALAARYFINWFTQHESEWATSAKVPASNKLAQSSDFTKLTKLQSFAADVPDVHFPPAVAGIGDATAKLYDAIQAAVLGKQSVDQALSTSAQAATKVLADNKKKYGA